MSTLFSDPILNVAREAAIIASHRMTAWVDALNTSAVGSKDGRNDLVTLADAEIEALVSHHLTLSRPHDTVVGEEGSHARALHDHPHGAEITALLDQSAAAFDSMQAAGHATGPTTGHTTGHATSDGPYEWHIDPIDGTVNFVRGIEHFCFSAGVRQRSADPASADDGWVAGLVAAPLLDRVWFARNGQAWSAPLAALTDPEAPLTELHGGSAATSGRVVATGFGYAKARRDQQLAALSSVMREFDDIRRCGSAAIDLCMAAEGRVNAYYERGLGVYDFAGGAYIAECAGRFVHRRSDAFLRGETGASIEVPDAVQASAFPSAELTVVADTQERFDFLLAHG